MSFILGVDLDGVCANYTKGLAALVEEDRGLSPGSLPDPTSWHFKNWNLDKEQFTKYHTELVINRDGFRDLEPIKDAAKVLWQLSGKGVWIRIITHRLIISNQHSKIASDTIAWLEDTGIPYRDICFLSAKSDVAADLYIDDAPHNIESLREQGKKTVVFDHPYNQAVEGLRTKSWQELQGIVLYEKFRKAISKLDLSTMEILDA